MQKIVVFNKTGYDPFIDFIKAYAIICVLIGHTFPDLNYIGYGLWAGMQVPLFILVQAFHSFKKETTVVSVKKIFWRIFLPFILFEGLIFVILLFVYHYNINNLINSFLIGGGTGPGSYYPWIYLQVALILPIFNKWMRNKSNFQLAITFLLICELFEIGFSLIDFPDWIYRLLAIRYLFLFYFAWLWVEQGITINKKTIILSLLSIASIIYFEYYSVNDEPLFFNTSWKFHRWPCYYFVATMGVYLLYCLFRVISKNHHVERGVKMLAKCSYEIFLTQMLVCSVFPSLNFIPNPFIRLAFRILLIFTLSIIGGFVFNKYYNTIIMKKIN